MNRQRNHNNQDHDLNGGTFIVDLIILSLSTICVSALMLWGLNG